MLPEKNYSQNIFIEISNLEHGGLGWELGTCLWSPVFDKAKSKKWQLLENVKVNDIIIHLIKISGEYYFYGVSNAISNIIKTESEPPKSSTWANMSPYQRINLNNFNIIPSPYPIKSFFSKFEAQLKGILKNNENNFYVEYGSSKELRMAQKYFAKCSDELYNLFNILSDELNFSPNFYSENTNIPTVNEPQNPDYNSPGRIETTISRIIRDTKLSKATKKENSWKCQICGTSLYLPNGYYYAEGHHLQPLGGEHEGPDVKENIIILCPNHHSEFDYGSIAINPETNLTEHLDVKNEYHNKSLYYERKDLGKEFLIYHYNQRFKKL